MPRAKNHDLDAQLIVRMSSDLKEALEAIAVDQDRTVAAEVRRALRQYVQQQTPAVA
ncbi:MAG: ribbon-helix-helix protein, CopG family [Actinomycetota bacterium]